MNKSDSERIARALENKGYKQALKENEANLIVVNMCSVRQSAVDRVYGLAEKIKKLKNKNPKLKAVLTGCILKRDEQKFKEEVVEEDKSSSSASELLRSESEGKEENEVLFAFVATRVVEEDKSSSLPFVATRVFNEIWKKEKLIAANLEPRRKSNFTAYVPISNGCNNFCSYCVVPFTRGSLVCRSHKKILKETREAIRQGKKEIWLLGQNVNDYSSLLDNKINFAKLIEKINEISGDFKFFFVSPHPKNFSNELINILTKAKKFGKKLNLPVQSGDNQILKKMNRNYTVKEYETLVEKIKKKMPEIKLSTDVIVGFPGETKKQFENTKKLFKKIKFNQAYISKYSVRTGTAASNLKDNISLLEKKKRQQCLRKLLLS